MRQRTLGRTGIQVSEVGFGCGPTAGLMVYGTPGEQAAAARRAFDLGITYFDTAPIYGEYVSEENLGRALQSAGIRPHIATKVALERRTLKISARQRGSPAAGASSGEVLSKADLAGIEDLYPSDFKVGTKC